MTANSGSSGAESVTVLRNTTALDAAVPSFAGPTPFDAGALPRWVAASDLNGDGRPDLVTPDFDNAVSVLVNGSALGAAPSFSEPAMHPAGESPQSVAAADVNRDGKPDLVTANSAGGNNVLVNATEPGQELRRLRRARPFGAGTSPAQVFAADLNGDARPDSSPQPVRRLDPAQHDAAPADRRPVEPRVRESGRRHDRRAEDRHARELDPRDAPGRGGRERPHRRRADQPQHVRRRRAGRGHVRDRVPLRAGRDGSACRDAEPRPGGPAAGGHRADRHRHRAPRRPTTTPDADADAAGAAPSRTPPSDPRQLQGGQAEAGRAPDGPQAGHVPGPERPRRRRLARHARPAAPARRGRCAAGPPRCASASRPAATPSRSPAAAPRRSASAAERTPGRPGAGTSRRRGRRPAGGRRAPARARAAAAAARG